MEDSHKNSQPKPSSFRNIQHLMIDSFHRLRNGLQRFIKAMLTGISSVKNFFLGLFTALFAAYEHVAMLTVYIVESVRNIFHYDYMGYFSWLFTLPKKYYTKCKEEAKKYVWMPIVNILTRKRNRIERAFKAKLRASAVYVRGFCELCRRLFLLTSDYTPGGKYTVTAFLAVVAIIFFLKILTVIRIFVQFVELAYSIAAFLLHPLLLTVRDILSIFDPLLQVFLWLTRIIARAVLSSLKAIGFFIWLNLISIASGLFRCWQYLVNSTTARSMWSLFVKAAYVLLENFVFVFLPFMTKITYYVGAVSVDVSCTAYTWLYPLFIRGFFEVSVNIDRIKYLTPSGIVSDVLIFWAMVLAFRFRNRLSGTFYSEIDGKQYPIRSSTASNTDRHKEDDQEEESLRQNMTIHGGGQHLANQVSVTVERQRGLTRGGRCHITPMKVCKILIAWTCTCACNVCLSTASLGSWKTPWLTHNNNIFTLTISACLCHPFFPSNLSWIITQPGKRVMLGIDSFLQLVRRFRGGWDRQRNC